MGGASRRPIGQPASAPDPAAAVKIVDCRLASLREVELEVVFWPLTGGWLVVAPVRRDLQFVDFPGREPPTVTWREIPLGRSGPHRLYAWRLRLAGPAWQYFPLTLRIDSLWLLPANAPLHQRATEVRGPWVFELSLPDGPAVAPARVPRLRPTAGARVERGV